MAWGSTRKSISGIAQPTLHADGFVPSGIDVHEITGPASYTTGGDAITIASEVASKVYGGWIISSDAEGYVFEVEQTSSSYAPGGLKLRCYYADYDAAADGKLIEIPATTDISGVTLTLARLVG